MPKQEGLEWFVINDFSPGIQQRVMFQGSDYAPAGLGVANADNTYRCIALPSGGLGPLPKRKTNYQPALPDSTTNLLNERFTISGFAIAGPVFDGSSGGGIDGVEAHFAYEYIYTSVTQGRRYKWQRHRMWESSPGIDTLKSITCTDSTTGTSTAFARPSWFHTYRADPSDATEPGYPVVANTWYAGGGGFERFWSIFPNLSTPSTVSVQDISTSLNAEHGITHQSRSVIFEQKAWVHATPGTWSFNEQVYFTNAKLASIASSDPSVFGEDNPTGYTCVGSLSANEMVLFKLAGGAYRLLGDIINPTVQHLPGVISPGNARHHGTSTPIGFIYVSDNGGAWVWSGGESSELLSAWLDGDFYDAIGTTDFLDYRGKLALWKEWVLLPKNWLYDYRTKSWWILENPDDIIFYHWDSTSIQSYLWGAPAYISTSQPIGASVFDYDVPASSYRWESQPIAQTMFRNYQIRQCILVAEGTGTVTVTLYKEDGSSDSYTFTLSSNYPTAQRANMSIDGSYIKVRIDSAHTSTGSAPVVYEVRLGYQSITHIKEADQV